MSVSIVSINPSNRVIWWSVLPWIFILTLTRSSFPWIFWQTERACRFSLFRSIQPLLVRYQPSLSSWTMVLHVPPDGTQAMLWYRLHPSLKTGPSPRRRRKNSKRPLLSNLEDFPEYTSNVVAIVGPILYRRAASVRVKSTVQSHPMCSAAA